MTTRTVSDMASSAPIWRFLFGFAYSFIFLGVIALAIFGLVVASPLLALAAMALYLFSHSLRAIRLSALSVELLGTSARTTAAVHFATAPFSILLPLKTGELVRFAGLRKISGQGVNAFVVILIDRMYDSLFLLPVLVFLTLQDSASLALTVLTLIVATVPLTVVVVGPKVLAEVQRYMVVNHNGAATLRRLKQIDLLRRIVSRAAHVALRQVGPLGLISFLIWLIEILVCVLLIGGLSGALDLLGGRLVAFWGDPGIDKALWSALLLTFLAQLLVWPFMVWIVVSRWQQSAQQNAKQIKGKR